MVVLLLVVVLVVMVVVCTAVAALAADAVDPAILFLVVLLQPPQPQQQQLLQLLLWPWSSCCPDASVNASLVLLLLGLCCVCHCSWGLCRPCLRLFMNLPRERTRSLSCPSPPLLLDLCELMFLLLVRAFVAAARAAVAHRAVAAAASSQARAFASSCPLGVDLVPGIADCCRFCYVWSCGPHPLNGLPHVICLCPGLPAHRIRVAAVGVDCIRVLCAMRLSILQAESMRLLSLSCQALPMLMCHGVFVPAFVSAHTAWATHAPASTPLPLLMFLNPLLPCL